MDHNPAPIKMLFYFCLDALLYLSNDEENVIAVHCKAGKGRTGLAICSYMIFMEGVRDAYEAVEYFNIRRTTDMKGMKIPSQIRYIHYFHNFLCSTFISPYK
jgi:phosphatidylinositol-3,4,5-trisphosphate 3-phosphatase/dual-specificity protein phosphatase PTEN